MSDPLPLERSPSQPNPWRSCSSGGVADPEGATVGSVRALVEPKPRKRLRMSSTSTPPQALILSQVASISDVSSENVPAGIPCAPPPTMPSHAKVPALHALIRHPKRIAHSSPVHDGSEGFRGTALTSWRHRMVALSKNHFALLSRMTFRNVQDIISRPRCQIK